MRAAHDPPGASAGRGLTYTAAVLEMAGETLEGAFVIKQLARRCRSGGARASGPHELPLLRMLCP